MQRGAGVDHEWRRARLVDRLRVHAGAVEQPSGALVLLEDRHGVVLHGVGDAVPLPRPRWLEGWDRHVGDPRTA